MKTITTRNISALGLCMALALAGGAAVRAGDQDFVLINSTGYDISEVYVSAAKANNWGEDVMGPDDTLDNGQKVTIEFARKEKECSWDMKIVFDDKEEAVWQAFDLCKVSEITLKYEGKRPTATYK